MACQEGSIHVSILAESAGDIGIVRLNDGKSLNAISPHMVEALLDAFRELSRSRRAIVLTGVGRAFCSGANLGSVDFLQAFRRIGVIPDAGTAYLLTRSVGRVRAMEMMMLGEKISAQTALDWGLVNRVISTPP